MTPLIRIIKFAFQDIARNWSLSTMTVCILTLMLLSVNTIILLRTLTEEATLVVKDQIDLSIFFDRSATDKQINDVRSHIGSFPEVTQMTFLTADQVLAQFKNDHKESPEILASLDELHDNPFGPTLIIKARDPSDYQKIITAIHVPEYEKIIEAKTFADTEKAIDRIHAITAQVEKFSIALSAIFALIACFIIFNTIGVAIFTQRTEISIKKLVGASNWFIQGPYLVEAGIFSLIAVGLTMGIVWVAVRFLDPYISVVFQTSSFLTSAFSSHILILVSAQFLAVLLLTLATSLLAMRRYLRV